MLCAPRVGIIKADLIDSIVSGSVGPYGWPGMGIDTKQWQYGRHFLLWRLNGGKRDTLIFMVLYCT